MQRSACPSLHHLAERTEMMQAWADYLDAIVDGAKVLRFKRAHG